MAEKNLCNYQKKRVEKTIKCLNCDLLIVSSEVIVTHTFISFTGDKSEVIWLRHNSSLGEKRPKANSQKDGLNTKTQDDNLTATWHLLSDGSQLASHNSICTSNIVRKSLLRKSRQSLLRCDTSCEAPLAQSPVGWCVTAALLRHRCLSTCAPHSIRKQLANY